MNSRGVGRVLSVAVLFVGSWWALPASTAQPAPVQPNAVAPKPPDSTYRAVPPARLLDTRPTGATVDGQSRRTGSVAAGSTTQLVITGRGGIPARGVGTAMVMITAVATQAAGFVTSFPSGSPRPPIATLSTSPGRTTANAAIVPVGAGGRISLYTSTRTHLVVDVVGWWPTAKGVSAVAARVFDSRPGRRTVDGRFAGGGVVQRGSSTHLTIAGRGGVPASGVTAVAVTITAVTPLSTASITAFPTGAPRPTTSSLVAPKGLATTGMAIVKLGSTGRISVHTSATSHVVIDVIGWWGYAPKPSPPPPPPSGRLDPTMFRYQGAFRLPVGQFGGSHFGYGGGQLALGVGSSPTLFVGGYGLDNQVAEVTIPTPARPRNASAAGLPVASIVQPFADPTGGRARGAIDDHRLGGIATLDGSLHWSVWRWYNVTGQQVPGHGWSSTNLAVPRPAGIWTLGRHHNQMTGGYIFAAPADWANAYTGGRRLIAGNTVSTATALSSSGPSFVAYRPTTPATGGALDALLLTNYPWEQHELHGYQRPDRIGGATWVRVNGVDSVLVVGRKSLGPTRYGVGQPGDCSQDQGWHGDPYEAQFMLYAASDLAAVAAGRLHAWEPRPYKVWSPKADLLPSCDWFLGGAVFDEATKRLYVSQIDADRASNEYEPMPVVHVWAIG